MKEKPEKRWWDLPAAGLLVAAMFTAASRLVATEWTVDLELSRLLVLIGVFAGLALGKSIFRTRVAAFFGLAYGAYFVPRLLGGEMHHSLLWADRLMILYRRLDTIIYQLSAREPVYDSLMFVALMAVLFWTLGLHAGFTLVRTGSAWRAVFPAGLTLFVIQTFDAVITQRAWFLAMYLFFTLVLVARLAFLHQHSQWRQSRTALPPNLGFDFIRYTLLAAALIVLFSWTAPALANTIPAAQRAWEPVRAAWNETKEQMDNAFVSLRTTVGIVSEYYGDSISLGSGTRLTPQLMFTVDPPPRRPANTRYYWRAQVYQNYANGKWSAAAPGVQTFNPQRADLDTGEFEARTEGSFTITSSAALSTLFTPAEPVWVSVPAETTYRSNPDGSLDVSTFRASDPIYPGESYETRGSVPSATIAQLREAGLDYPDWIVERYLQVPDNVTGRTSDLAAQITDGLDNPYDKAVAITHYLRENIIYSETIPTPPRDQEPIDWFLFDLRTGYCEYYASAEVIMLRTLGIPARLVAGYAQGEIQANGNYIVRQHDAHSWVEAYFPQYGWVEFEPTTAQPEIVRRLGVSTREDSSLQDERDMIRRQLDQLDDELLLPEAGANLPGQGGEAGAMHGLMVGGAYLIGGLTLLAAGWKGAQVSLGLPSLSVLIVDWMARRNLTPPQWLILAARRARQQAPRRRPSGPPLAFQVERLILRLGWNPPDFIARWSYWSMLPPLARSYVEINRALGRLGRPARHTETPSERAAALGRILPPTDTPARFLVSEYQHTAFGQQSERDSQEPVFIAMDDQAAVTAGREIRSLSFRAAWQARWQQLVRRLRLPGA